MAASFCGRSSAGNDASRIVQVLQDLIAASGPSIPCHPARDAAIYLVVELTSRLDEERARQELIEGAAVLWPGPTDQHTAGGAP